MINIKVFSPFICKKNKKNQSIAVSWSPLCITENYDSFSIIAVGSKGGSVTLWKFKEDENNDDYLSYLDTLDSIHKSWVTITSWSKWISYDENKC